jgi:hypothetical protein
MPVVAGRSRLLRSRDDEGAMRQSGEIEVLPQDAGRRVEALWTSQDVADFLRVSLRWVEKQRALAALPCLALPGRRLVRYDPAAFRAWALQRAWDGEGRAR